MIDKDTVVKMAKLSKLALSDAEIPEFQAKFNKIMTVIDKVTAVNTDNIVPMHNALDDVARLREDVVTETNQREELLSQAPASENGFFKVPKVLD